MSNPDHTPEQTPPGLPPAPWILLDRTTATQAAAVLDRLEQWLAGAGEPGAVEACAHACSLGEADAANVAAGSTRWPPGCSAASRRRTRGRDHPGPAGAA